MTLHNDGTLDLLTSEIHWAKEHNTFIVEASDLRIRPGANVRRVKITNPKTGNNRLFKYVATDMDATDIFGWKFVSPDGIKFLLIND